MIKLSNISKKFGSKELFNNLNIQINRNEKIILRAPSGSGKTTLVKLLLGFEKPDAGNITINNLSLSRSTLRSVRQHIAYVSQDADLAQSTVKAVFDNVFNYKVNRHIEGYQKKFLELSHHFGLEEDIYKKEVKSLSGGERQRVALILALVLDRDIMILDEITSGLDAELKHNIKNYILALDKTIIIISHDEIWHTENGLKEVKLNDYN